MKSLPTEPTDHPLGELKAAKLSKRQARDRKINLLTHSSASHVSSIANAIVIKDEDIFFLASPEGELPLSENHGLGLFYHDCRYLRGYELRIDGEKPDVLAAASQQGFMSVFELTNPAVSKKGKIPQNKLSIKWQRVLDSKKLALQDQITFQNFSLETVEFEISLAFQTEFEDVFYIRSLLKKKYGKLKSPRWEDDTLFFQYNGKDGVYRGLGVHFLPAPDHTKDTTARFSFKLQPSESTQLNVTLLISESGQEDRLKPDTAYKPDLEQIEKELHRSVDGWVGKHAAIESNNMLFDGIIKRSLLDLRMLRSKVANLEFFAAGVPWFVNLFGRDSIISAYEILAYEPGIAAQTLRLLALYQGQREDSWRDEEPGKIMHSLRVGEMARLGEIPHTPFYGSVDATPLFLILLAKYVAWTGDLDLFAELKLNVEKALDWINKYGEPLGKGYLAYNTDAKDKQINQGWKDSGNAIVDADGSLAGSPIALAEVQGYTYLAKQQIADLYEYTGEAAKAAELRKQATDLQQRFNQDFWLTDRGFYTLALHDGHKPAAVLSSNAGQVLWSGIADSDKAAQMVVKLMGKEMFSGWGVRTLSTEAKSYNPISYHLGSVWPHDNALIAAGFRRYGADESALRIFKGIFEATTHFDYYRLPELFTGFEKAGFEEPVRYPVACHPQAWAAGSLPFMLETLLGLQPDALKNCLRIVRPVLPDFLQFLIIRNLRVGQAKINLKFERDANNTVKVEVLEQTGKVKVVVD